MEEVVSVTKDETTCALFESTNVLPDYSAEYTFADAGDYTLELTVDNGNGPKVLTKNIHVGETSAPYVVTRTQATRLFPLGGSPATLSVLFNQDFSGAITEVAPKDFEISAISDNGVIVDAAEGKDFKTITWSNISATTGDTKTFTYTYDAPDVSPMYYKAGPLTLNSGST